MLIDLNETQVDELRSLLEVNLRELSYEIASADLPSYRRQLREKREVIRSALAGISGAIPVAGS
ncbi:MAG: hypothetical protein ACLPVY_12300 [Acidimicrobiia bacterium]